MELTLLDFILTNIIEFYGPTHYVFVLDLYHHNLHQCIRKGVDLET